MTSLASKPPWNECASIEADRPLELASGTGSYNWDIVEDRLSWTDGLLNIYGLDAAPQGESGFSQYVHPDDRVRVEAETTDYLSSAATVYSHTFRIVRPDGAVRFILDRGMIERDAKRRATCIRGINVDLTDLPQVNATAAIYDESAVQRFAELEALYAEAPLGLAMLDRDLRFVRINSALAEINGCTVEQHLGRVVWDILPDLRKGVEPILQRVLDSGLALRDVTVVGETPAQPGNVREWREHFYPLRGSNGLVLGIGIVCEEVTRRRAAQRALLDSEARLAAALRAGQLGVHEFDPRTGNIRWDATVRALWQVSADEPITFETFAAGIHPADVAAMQAAVDAALDPDGTGHYEAEYRVIQRQTRQIRRVRADGDVTFDGRDAVKLIGTVQDITERKVVEAALALSEQRFKLALAGSPITVFEHDAELRYQWIYNSNFGPAEDYFVGKTDDDIMDPDVAETLVTFKRRVLESGQPERKVVVAKAHGHPLRHLDLHVHPRCDDAGRVTGLTCVATDITERKREESALREGEERFRNMADNAPVMVWVTEPDGSCTYLSATWYKFTGQTPEEALGFGWLKAVHPDDMAESARVFRDANDHHEPFRLDYRLRRADGIYRWAIDSARPRLGANGEFLGFIGSVIDITERKEAETLKAFHLKLSDTLRPLNGASEILENAARLLCQELGANGTIFYELHADKYVVRASYATAAPSLMGTHAIAAFGDDLLKLHRRGKPIVVDDVTKTHRHVELRSFSAIEIGAYLAVPLVKEGQTIAGCAIHSTVPRSWTEAEVRMAEETVERVWAAMERARAEQQQRQSEKRYRTLFETIDEGFCVIEVRFDEPDGRIDYRILEANPAFYNQTGFSEAILGSWLREVAPDLEEHWYETYGRVASTGEPSRFEQHSEMLGRWFDVYAFPLGAPQDRRVAILFTDISQRKRNEEHMHLLMNEVNHRAKNMLALVDAVAKQTASSGNQDFVARFSERVRALAASQDLLVQTDWDGASLATLIESQLLHFKDLVGHRITLDGPEVEVSPKAAQSLGMALHELATNAAKYGALSNEKGRIGITWQISNGVRGSHFSITWKETKGPRVVPPTHEGFGQRVAKAFTAAALSADVTLTYPSTGVVWTLSCPLTYIGAFPAGPK